MFGLDGLEVGEHAAEPALVHVGHAAALGLVPDRVLRLLLRADEEHGAALAGHGLSSMERASARAFRVFWRSMM